MFRFSHETLLALVGGALYGAVFGALPGLTATLALSLFVPFALFLEPSVAFAAIVGITATAIFAGDVGAVAVRIPGTPASAAYTEEIHELGRRRSPAFALGLAAFSSALGSLAGLVFLVAGSLGLARIAGQFSSFEFFWLVLLGVVSGIFATPSVLKGVLAFAFGMLIATVGVDPALGIPRFAFGNVNLLGGVHFIVALIAFFGVSEVLRVVYERHQLALRPTADSTQKQLARSFFLEAPRVVLGERRILLRSSLLGTFVGFLPGAGSDLAAWMSANLSRTRRSRADQVVVAGSASNNAAVAGTWIPALSLGIPGDTLTAIALGLFMVLGITPGPDLFRKNFGLVLQIYAAFFLVSAVLLPVVGFVSATLVNQLVQIPRPLFLGGVMSLCLVGTYAINRNPFDLYVMLVLGTFGLLLQKAGIPLGQLVLGLVLGPLLEQHLMVSLIKTHWDVAAFFHRPLALFLALVNVVFLSVMGYTRLRRGHEDAAARGVAMVNGLYPDPREKVET